VEYQLRLMNGYYGLQNTFMPVVHIGFIGLRPNIRKGFHIITQEDRSHQIPLMQLPGISLDEDQTQFVLGFADKTVDEILKELRVQQTTTMDLICRPLGTVLL